MWGFIFLNKRTKILSIDVFDNKTGTHQLLKYGSVKIESAKKQVWLKMLKIA